ncbi:hypothetical protein [Streptomyces sp. BPTC-684]|uniref:hypothetical protein n=1 Tax=Streptomyces sp. BPTC-684 TaxID=3043734 RepID=UPI0024B2232B|nr:hypothetical protein [Streptomyces sp. BPTC-684]WHM40658.1 hypothetical protein QIY60_29820 [Streptomyces sp. BPTC-684]
MYALLFPTLTPFILLSMVMGLAWWEDRVLPRTEPDRTPAAASAASGAEATEAPFAPGDPAPIPRLAVTTMALTGEIARS